MIHVENVSKRIRSKIVLQNIHLKIEKGEVLGLVGPNGAGKSTFLSLLSTTVALDEGEIWIGGHSLRKEAQEVRKKIGYVPQEIALYSSLSVFDNLMFWATLANVKERKTRVEEIVRRLGLQEYLKVKVERLSGGYKRRVNIAVALLQEPQVLIMDEPTVGMDLYSKQELLPFLKSLANEGATIIYTSHDADELLYLTDRVALLEKGNLVYEGPIDEARHKLPIFRTIG